MPDPIILASRGLLRDYEPSCEPSFEALTSTVSYQVGICSRSRFPQGKSETSCLLRTCQEKNIIPIIFQKEIRTNRNNNHHTESVPTSHRTCPWSRSSGWRCRPCRTRWSGHRRTRPRPSRPEYNSDEIIVHRHKLLSRNFHWWW